MRLIGSVVGVNTLDQADRTAMFDLMDQLYVNLRRESFERDLSEKQWLIRLAEPTSGRLVGFSTQQLLEAKVDGEPMRALFSGDTVVERAHWGDMALASTWGNFALDLIHRYADQPLYWFLITKGFRTYRYLPLFFREFYPRYDAETPAELLPLVDALAGQVGGTHYDPKRQIIRAGDDKEYVRAEFNACDERGRRDRHVEYFVARNPGYERGDELCCLAPLTRENFTPLAWRMIDAQPPVECGA